MCLPFWRSTAAKLVDAPPGLVLIARFTQTIASYSRSGLAIETGPVGMGFVHGSANSSESKTIDPNNEAMIARQHPVLRPQTARQNCRKVPLESSTE